MQGEPWVFVHPGLNIGVLVGGVVVQDDAQPHPGMGFGDQFEKGQELDVGVTRVAGVSGDLAGGDLQRGEQAGRAVADVIMGLLLGNALAQRQNRLGPIQRLDLGFFVDTDHHRTRRRVQVGRGAPIQALDRTQPILPLRQGIPEQQTHDHIRHGTTSLFAALEVATGKVTADACYPRHTNVEFLAFLKLVAKAHPRVRLCVICDNYATHKHPNVQAWLDKNPRITLHFTPTSCSWLNLVEIFFGIITRQAIRRGTFTDVTDLQTAIRTYIDSYNEHATPFSWTKTADELLGKIKRKSINNTRH